MSTKKLESPAERFNKWKEDLEERLAKHLFKHPEEEPPKEPETKNVTPLYAEKWLDEKARHGDKVFVVESISMPGAWCIYKNGQCFATFFGGDAYGRASVAAGKMLQD